MCRERALPPCGGLWHFHFRITINLSDTSLCNRGVISVKITRGEAVSHLSGSPTPQSVSVTLSGRLRLCLVPKERVTGPSVHSLSHSVTNRRPGNRWEDNSFLNLLIYSTVSANTRHCNVAQSWGKCPDPLNVHTLFIYSEQGHHIP